MGSSTCHTSPSTPFTCTQPQEGVDVQIRWFPGAMAVGLGALDTADGLGRCGDALGAAGPSNTPVGVVGGVLVVLVNYFSRSILFLLYFANCLK